jgi:hypothetical protein
MAWWLVIVAPETTSRFCVDVFTATLCFHWQVNDTKLHALQAKLESTFDQIVDSIANTPLPGPGVD